MDENIRTASHCPGIDFHLSMALSTLPGCPQIVLHQILQWHNMVSNWYPPTTMETMMFNMTWDGIFHSAVWIVTLIGVFTLWSAAYRRQPIPSLTQFVGGMVLGWGLFNLIEGIIDHQILGIHYVRQVPHYSLYNLTFLVVGGFLLIVIGVALMKADTIYQRKNIRN